MKARPRLPRRWREIAPATLLVIAGLSCGGLTTTGPKPASNRPGVSEVVEPAADKVAAGQTLQIPVYSHVYTADNAEPLNLAATVFVRNTDADRPIVLTRVDYFDSGGKLIRGFVPKPLMIGPMASVDFFVKESDVTGGASPSFVVEWVSTESPTDPIVESVMIGTSGTQGISFTSPGRVIRSRKP
jgi:Protein of unknown function (DUF3124)